MSQKRVKKRHVVNPYIVKRKKSRLSPKIGPENGQKSEKNGLF